MNLIDRDKVLKTIPSEEMVARMAVMSAPVVDAIPIEWIKHYMDTRLTKGSLFYSCMSEFMRDWQKEHEKQNEKNGS